MIARRRTDVDFSSIPVPAPCGHDRTTIIGTIAHARWVLDQLDKVVADNRAVRARHRARQFVEAVAAGQKVGV